MKRELTRNVDEIKKRLLVAESLDHFADLLEVSRSTLVFYLYRNRTSNYVRFEISKKSGGVREIYAPIGGLKILQRKLCAALGAYCDERDSVHGFRNGRSIVTNAARHVKGKVVANIDLENFFPTINFGRVRGLFLSSPFYFDEKIATMLAQLCCREGILPQGAPTSPMISNFICRKMDGQMMSLAARENVWITRYADDITLSSRRQILPSTVLNKTREGVEVGGELRRIIELNGFSVNHKKTRVASVEERQLVTGLVVNKRVNVERRYLRRVRAMLFEWEKNGLEAAQKKFETTECPDVNSRGNKVPDVAAVLLGRINFIRMVRGRSDKLYRTYYNRYLKLIGSRKPRLPLNQLDAITDALWVVQGAGGTGSGFFLDGVGIITCFHVVKSGTTAQVWKSNNPEKKYSAVVLCAGDGTRDGAVLQLRDLGPEACLMRSNQAILEYSSQVTASGFHNYREGDTPTVTDTRTAGGYDEKDYVLGEGQRRFQHVKRVRIGPHVMSGMSGGPITDGNAGVVGIITAGFSPVAKGGMDKFEFSYMPLSEIDSLVERGKTVRMWQIVSLLSWRGKTMK